jgi:2-polyprenyl-3-methyl-5-hydroxy-6-metoxy-1,4-benzoquinol methylase
MRQLTFKEETFEVVICLEGIEHVNKKTGIQFISEVHKVLKQNGILLLSAPRHKTREHSGNPYHIIEYKLNELVEIIDPFFHVNTIQRREVDDLNIYFIEAIKK